MRTLVFGRVGLRHRARIIFCGRVVFKNDSYAVVIERGHYLGDRVLFDVLCTSITRIYPFLKRSVYYFVMALPSTSTVIGCRMR